MYTHNCHSSQRQWLAKFRVHSKILLEVKRRCWFSPYFQLLIQIVDLSEELQVLGRQGPPAADEHETRQQESSDQERRTSASTDSHTVDSHHSCFRVAYGRPLLNGTYATLSPIARAHANNLRVARVLYKTRATRNPTPWNTSLGRRGGEFHVNVSDDAPRFLSLSLLGTLSRDNRLKTAYFRHFAIGACSDIRCRYRQRYRSVSWSSPRMCIQGVPETAH